MNVGILTHHWVPNFGANLQATATSLALKYLSHTPIFLNYRPENIEKAYHAKIQSRQIEEHENHFNTYYKQTRILRTENDLVAACDDANIKFVLAGSDTILRIRRITSDEKYFFPNPFWMRWVKNVKYLPKKAMISASAEGTYYWFFNKNTKQVMADAILELDSISVRDRWTRNMILHLTQNKINPLITPDPVSVLNKLIQVPAGIEDEPIALRKQYILLHVSQKVFSESWIKEFCNLAHKNNLQVFTLPNPGNQRILPVDKNLTIPMSPLKWYMWIRHAAGFLGDGFHTIVSCIYNNVPFISVDTSGPMLFKCLSIRESSKAYDMCQNVKMAKNSYLPVKARFLLSPKVALNRLLAQSSNLFEPYASQSSELFVSHLKSIIK